MKKGLAPAEIAAAARAEQINVSISQAAYARFDLPQRGLDSVVRFSPHYYNTEDEIEAFVQFVDGLDSPVVRS